MELHLLQELLSSGADGATIILAVLLFKVERRTHNLEIYTGLKKLIEKA